MANPRDMLAAIKTAQQQEEEKKREQERQAFANLYALHEGTIVSWSRQVNGVFVPEPDPNDEEAELAIGDRLKGSSLEAGVYQVKYQQGGGTTYEYMVQIAKDKQDRLSARYQLAPSTARDRIASLSSLSTVPGKVGSRSYNKYKNGMIATMTRFARDGVTDLRVGFPNCRKKGEDGKEKISVVGVRAEALVAMVEAALETRKMTQVPVTVTLDDTARAVYTERCNDAQRRQIDTIVQQLDQANKQARTDMAREAAIETLRGMEVPATVNDEWIKKLKQQIDVLKDTDLTGVTQDQCEVLLNEKGGKLVRMLQKTEELFNRAQQAAEPVERQLQAQQQSISSLEEKIKVFSAAGRSTAQLEQQLADQKKALEDAKTNAAPILQKRDDLKAINEGGAKVQASLQARQEDIKNPGGLRPTTPGSTT